MKPQQFFFVVLGLIALIGLGGGVGYYYAYGHMREQSQELATTMAKQNVILEQINALDSLQHTYNRDIVPILPLIDAALPRDKKQTEILAQIERIAVSTGVKQPFDSITVPGPAGLPTGLSQTINAGVVLALPINFTAVGTYDQLQAFTAQLESLNRYTNVTNLAITSGKKGGPLTYTFSVNAYIKP